MVHVNRAYLFRGSTFGYDFSVVVQITRLGSGAKLLVADCSVAKPCVGALRVMIVGLLCVMHA